ncbi:head maturation protease, ClpP-related [Senegalia massiliensis]|uniref:ATP-dependent Clp protease proteolytic subunit n=1 Tax=Senegalia massiliensis TaxID=1720316 RepID=A0A845QUQ7_9CLOT|nr:Clp protease ClpP [Senegalia massiliensis]
MKINVKGPIVPSSNSWIYKWLGIEATSPQDVNKILDDLDGEDVEVEINSGGGSVFAGSEIYTALKSYKGNVTVKIVGIAASAASVIAMAGNKVMMSPTGQMMIHNSSVSVTGDYRQMDNTSKFLKNVNKTIANAYKIKTGIKEEELLSLMDNETWMTPEMAKENKFIDEIMFEKEFDAVASFDNSAMIPQQVIDKLKEVLAEQKSKEQKTEIEDNSKNLEVTNKLKELDLILKLR